MKLIVMGLLLILMICSTGCSTGCSTPPKCTVWIPIFPAQSILQQDYKTAIEKSALGPKCKCEF